MKQTAVQWLVEQLTSIGQLEIPKGSNVVTEIIKQAKAMEREQMCSFAEFVATYPDKNININGEMLHAKSKYDGAERTVDLLETFIVP
jgi:hypothetical protein